MAVTQTEIKALIVQLQDQLMSLACTVDEIDERVKSIETFTSKVESTLDGMAPMMEKFTPMIQMFSPPIDVPSSMDGVNVLGQT